MPELMKGIREKLNMLGEVNTCACHVYLAVISFRMGEFLILTVDV